MTNRFSILHTTQIGNAPFWYHLENSNSLTEAARRAYSYALNHGGYVCVKDKNGHVVFGTDPTALGLAILNGTNRDFPKETARRMGCVA